MAKTSTYTISSLKTVKGDPTVLGGIIDGSATEIDLRDTGITKVKDYGFYGGSKLTKLLLPDTCQEIGTYAFYNCSSLTTLGDTYKLPEFIDKYVFYNTPALKNVDASNVRIINEYGLSVTGVSIDKLTNLVGIKRNAIDMVNGGSYPIDPLVVDSNTASSSNPYFKVTFNGKEWLTGVYDYKSGSTTEFNSHTIAPKCANGNSVKEVIISENVKRFCGGVVGGGSYNITKVTLPSLDHWFSISNITDEIFSDYSKYKSIITKKFNSLFNGALHPHSDGSLFDGNRFDARTGYYLYVNDERADTLTEFTLPDNGINMDGKLASFSNLETLNLNIPQYVKNEIKFYNDGGLNAANEQYVWSPFSLFGRYSRYDDFDSACGNAYLSGTFYDWNPDLIFIPMKAHYLSNNSYSVYVPKTLKNINIDLTDSAFIPSQFFRHTSSREFNVNINNPESGIAIGKDSFNYYGSTNHINTIVTFTNPLKVNVLRERALCAEIVTPDDTIYILDNAIIGRTSLAYTSGLKKMVIGKDLQFDAGARAQQKIGLALGDVASITFDNLKFGTTVANVLGSDNTPGWLQYSASLSYYSGGYTEEVHADTNATSQRVYLPPTLEEVTILNGDIYKEAFSGFSMLKKINLPENCTFIGANAFQGTGIEKVHFPSQNELKIFAYAFSNSSALTEVVIPINVTTIKTQAFHRSDATTPLNIYCEAVSKPDGWNDNWYVNSHNTITVYWGGQWHYDESGNPVPNE